MRQGLTFSELAELTGASFAPSGAGSESLILRVSSVTAADAGSLVFAEEERSLEAAIASGAGAILALDRFTASAPKGERRLLLVAEPRYAFALVARELSHSAEKEQESPVHASAAVDRTAVLGQRVRIGAGATVGARARLGDDVVIGSRAVVAEDVVIGNRVIVQAGAVLGSTGFGYVRHQKSGEYLLFPQQGSLVIEDDVEIGANTTIDRGALEETRIGRGTKIDNLVHIGHNCRVGKSVVIAAQVGISGSCVVEDGAVLAGQVGISDHCHIGPGVILGGQAGVYRGKTVTGPGEIFAGTPAEPLREQMKSLATLRNLRRGRR